MITRQHVLAIEQKTGRNTPLRRKFNNQRLTGGQIEDVLNKLTSKVNGLLKQPLDKMLSDIEEVKTLIEKVKTDVQKLKEQVKRKNDSEKHSSSSNNNRKRQKPNSFCEKIEDPALLPICENSKWLLDDIHLLSDEELRELLEKLYIRPLAWKDIRFWALEKKGQTVRDLVNLWGAHPTNDFGTKVLIPLIENITDWETKDRFQVFIKILNERIEKKKYLKQHGRSKAKFNKGNNAIYMARGRFWNLRSPYPGEKCIITERNYNERQKKWFYDINLTMSAYTRQHFPNETTLTVPEDSLINS